MATLSDSICVLHVDDAAAAGTRFESRVSGT